MAHMDHEGNEVADGQSERPLSNKTFQPKASMKEDSKGRLVQGKEDEKQGLVVIATGRQGRVV